MGTGFIFCGITSNSCRLLPKIAPRTGACPQSRASPKHILIRCQTPIHSDVVRTARRAVPAIRRVRTRALPLCVSAGDINSLQKRHYKIDHQLLLCRLGLCDHHRQRDKRMVGNALGAVLAEKQLVALQEIEEFMVPDSFFHGARLLGNAPSHPTIREDDSRVS